MMLSLRAAPEMQQTDAMLDLRRCALTIVAQILREVQRREASKAFFADPAINEFMEVQFSLLKCISMFTVPATCNCLMLIFVKCLSVSSGVWPFRDPIASC